MNSISREVPTGNGSAAAAIIQGRILLPHHLAELHASGLTADTIRRAGIYSITDTSELARILNWTRARATAVPALAFPFHDAGGYTGYARAKLDRPRTRDGQPIKYESPKGLPNALYLPPSTIATLTDPSVPLLITEGEKKSLAADQDGFACVGTVGIFGWKQFKREELIPAMAQISWLGRDVFIAFDSDRATNHHVRLAESRLALQLQRRGADVKIVHLPPGPAANNGVPTKVGVDDYLLAHGADALRALLADAGEPDPTTSDELRRPASGVDPRDEIQRYLDLQKIDGVPRLLYWRGSWWWWADGRYIEQSTDDVQAGFVRHVNNHLSMLSTHHIAHFKAQLRAQAAIPSSVDPPCWLGPPPRDWLPHEIIVCRNQIVHLPSLTAGSDFSTHATPLFFTPAALEFGFDINAPRPDRWLHFMHQLWPNDLESIETLQEIFGYCLTPDTRQQKFFFFLGPTRCGKGTIGRVLAKLVGMQNVVAPTLSSLSERFGLWPLLGKTVAIISDARLGGRATTAALTERLLSISGEDANTVDRKNDTMITCKLLVRFLILSNELPALQDASGALAARFVLLRFTNSWLGREDETLTDRLCGELAGILIWAIEGWHRQRQRGRFLEPASTSGLHDELNRLVSPIMAFLNDRCVLGPQMTVARIALYNAYKAWCQENGVQSKDTARFGGDLRAAVPGLESTQPRDGGRRSRVHVGIALRSDSPVAQVVAHV